MAASPSLSHSSQDKAGKQGGIQQCQGVSDECGSGVVRVVQEAQSIPSLVPRPSSRAVDPLPEES